ncbi:hypothetical protein B296_00053760 [Ensete ventricosum]|uniref:Fatty acid desaturase N-terminal domain-containing protein n=1 Tax=Ensete ventricosum TaxID=4639 RepID=A0A426Y6K6_ENSVE|nr:hypothetical protein B296_00053760 [Ensete ventricosum]
MASRVLSSERCVFRPLPAAFSRPKSGLRPPTSLKPLRSDCSRGGGLDLCRPVGLGGRREWQLGVSALARMVPFAEEMKDGEGKGERVASGCDGEEEAFDPAMPPPFWLAEIRAAIPKHCWEKDPWRSMSYVVRDVVAVFGLAAAAAFLDNWIAWPLYWVAQGTMFWALFVLGHDCHRTHHQNHGHAENDESWHPIFVMWLDLVTYLHHHGHNEKLPWEPVKSGPLPLHLFGVLAKSLARNHYVSDTGDVVYYQSDDRLSDAPETESH